MTKRKLGISGAAAVAVLGLGGLAAVAAGTSPPGIGGDTDTPITGPELEKASAAALESTGGGTVTETEVGDEESLYEVEVALPDGSQVDVQLDEAFQVVGTEADTEDPDDTD